MAAAGGLLGSPSPAFATDCAGLQAALDAAVAGDTVTLDEGSVCTGPYTLPPRAITFVGGGSGATIDGGGVARALVGENVGATTLQNLTFQNGAASGGGGGVSISGTSTPTFIQTRFYGNSTTGDGGGLFITSTVLNGRVRVSYSDFGDANAGNTGARGGGAFISGENVSVTLIRNKFIENRATDGFAGGLFVDAGTPTRSLSDNVFSANVVAPGAAGEARGGGAYIRVRGAATDASRNVFNGNVLEPATAIASGAGLALQADDYAAAVTQYANQFRENTVLDDAPQLVPGLLTGAGESAAAIVLTSNADHFVNNTLGQQVSPAAGAALALIDCSYTGKLTFRNLVMVGNIAEGSTAGTALAAGCGPGKVTLTLESSTITGNTPVDAGAVGGDSSDSLVAVNSILTTSGTPFDDIVGFASRTVTFSDACTLNGVQPGAGNICVSPGLVDMGQGAYRETPTGVTIDAGLNSAVAPMLVYDADLKDLRIVDGDLDGLQTVDIGADEFAPGATNPSNPVVGGGFVGGSTAPHPSPATPESAQVVAGVRATPQKKPKKCGDKFGPTSRFLNKLSSAARFRGAGLVMRGTARYRKCKGGRAGAVKRVMFSIRLVDGKTCRFLTRQRTLGKPTPCRKRATLVRATGKSRWQIAIRGTLPDGRYLAGVQAVDDLGNTERRSSHRNFRHFRIQGGLLKQGWHGTQPDDYTKRG